MLIFLAFSLQAGSTRARVKQHAVLDTIKASLEDHNPDLTLENEIRYKLLIDTSGDESIIRFLFAFRVLERSKTHIYVCSKFPGDTETQKVWQKDLLLCTMSLLQSHSSFYRLI